MSCGTTTQYNNTYFYNKGYPGTFNGSGRCSITVKPCDSKICQLRIDFLTLSLAPPNGDGHCTLDNLQITGGSSRVPLICGENSGQHVYVNFNGDDQTPITISVATSASYSFNRQWQFQIAQLACSSSSSSTLAPSGCLQYHFSDSGKVQSFNYAATPNPLPNQMGMTGARQLANHRYGICVRMAANKCSITWSQIPSDPLSMTITGDVEAIQPELMPPDLIAEQNCLNDFIIIPNPKQYDTYLPSDRFCGLRMAPVTSHIKPFILYVVTDNNELNDVSNRGFYLQYEQNDCPIII